MKTSNLPAAARSAREKANQSAAAESVAAKKLASVQTRMRAAKDSSFFFGVISSFNFLLEDFVSISFFFFGV